MKKISKLFTLPRLVLKSWIPLYKSSITNLHQFFSSACSSSWTFLHAPIHGLKRGPIGLPSVQENAGLAIPQNRVSGNSPKPVSLPLEQLSQDGRHSEYTSLVYPGLSYGQLYSKANRCSKVYSHMLHQFMERRDKYTIWLIF